MVPAMRGHATHVDRHMSRHRQKDEEAGAEGCGVLNTRKRMWKDAEGRIVTKKPAISIDASKSQSASSPHSQGRLQSLPDFAYFNTHEQGLPISPPTSHNPSLSHSLEDHDSGIGINYQPAGLDPKTLSAQDSFSPTDQRFWSADITQPQPDPFASTAFDDASFEDIFNPDTASSFNAPFTTMSNYSWLFEMDWAKSDHSQQLSMQDPFPMIAFPNNPSPLPQPGQSFDLNLDHTSFEKPSETLNRFEPLPSQISESLQGHLSSPPMITPPLYEHGDNPNTTSQSQQQIQNTAAVSPKTNPVEVASSVPDIERPMSMLRPSRSLPVIDELARQQLLDLVDIIQPTMPDGSIVMRDHPLLSLSCLQTYCDLFFTRFNTTYPLIHMSTFDPSEVDTLLLASVLLLGATYGEKDAHQLAVCNQHPLTYETTADETMQVCIHDVLRPQIFANAGFSSKPDLWVLQTILLVECFGKSRAGQKQHDMSHLFHGLLINLIRRSDCQSIRPPTPDDSTDDLEDDWRTWCEAEEKKRLAFLCFMWDTQHAVLFCQSLCMSAFELRSNMPCDQAVWEADSAESWHQARQKQPTTPLFLSCLKMYLHPDAAAKIPKTLNALSRALLLHGLMSVAWDMQRRDQTSLGVLESHNPLGNWQVRLANSYNSWHADYTAFCTTYLSALPSPSHFLAKEFQIHRTATLALYHAAHILLHTPFLDLQIYAGARHILGRPVARHDYARSQRVVKKWVLENTKKAGKAVWHASAIVSDGVDVLDGELSASDIGGARLWHHAWIVYLGTLVVWGVWYARPVPPPAPDALPSHLSHLEGDDGDEDEMVWDPSMEMKTLLDGILKSEPSGLLEQGVKSAFSGGVGKRGTNGLAAVVSRCLSKVRWAVVHDGMMVLRGLVQWRLVGGGGGAGAGFGGP
ncbi:Fungal-trans domain containing protein [Pyrenophora teres f. teres]|uniref:Fungal-trans domain containing protein n=1 Tax=Pyrenophora teres f. teres TaxID=97479 RepID=A0A6S6VV44_9PLEO|nr:Fungal-trans domain containing protein [Pyrenophora teres f. teres]